VSIGERLRTAVGSTYPSVLQFQKDVEREFERRGGKARGCSYPSIAGYLKDYVKPNLDFIDVAAEMLGVSPVWLAHGIGPRDAMPEPGEACPACALRSRRIADAVAILSDLIPEEQA
jgi:hypothetical protein